MKLERECNIPAFKGKTRRERKALRELARARDNSIIVFEILGCVFVVPILLLSNWLTRQYSSWLPFLAVYFLAGYFIFALYHALFVTPRIRRALESEAKPSV